MANTFNINELKDTFFAESREMLDAMEEALLNLEKDPGDEESIHSLFRSVHTIKGSSGMFGFEAIERFTHVVENVLDKARKGDLRIEGNLPPLLFDCHDFIGEILDFYEQGERDDLPPDTAARMNTLFGRLEEYADPAVKSTAAASGLFAAKAETADAGRQVQNENWHISLRFGDSVFRNGYDPSSFIAYLNEIGAIMHISTVTDAMPPFDELDPENCYLGFEIDFKGSVSKEAIVDVFEFVKDDCEIRVIPPKSSINDYVALINDLPESPMLLGDILTSVGSLTDSELKDALNMQERKSGGAGAGDKQFIGDIMVEEGLVHKQVLDAALEKQERARKSDERNKKLIRVHADKIDNLINLVGELVINGSNIKQISERRSDTELSESTSTMNRLIEEIRDSTMNIRMVPIGETFKKFERTVRDLSREQGKEIDLVVTGGDTELDKSLIDKISDPLMHLIRNSIDHGIDLPAEREKKGKPRRGTIYLNAYYETGNVVIVGRDDGNGLDRDGIYAKAVELGFIQPNQQVDDDVLFQYIFEPGFSTAQKVTNISGRGVGMDVVRKNIESLRGTIILESRKGEGTSVRINLPLTLAIIDGFLVKVGDLYYVLPLDIVVECTEISSRDLQDNDGGNFINLRGEVLPYLRLRDFFAIGDDYRGKENVVVLEYARKKAGIVIDRPVGEFQTVIKPLGRLFSHVRWVSGATILGTGDVALILDVPRLMQNSGDARHTSAKKMAVSA